MTIFKYERGMLLSEGEMVYLPSGNISTPFTKIYKKYNKRQMNLIDYWLFDNAISEAKLLNNFFAAEMLENMKGGFVSSSDRDSAEMFLTGEMKEFMRDHNVLPQAIVFEEIDKKQIKLPKG